MQTSLILILIYKGKLFCLDSNEKLYLPSFNNDNDIENLINKFKSEYYIDIDKKKIVIIYKDDKKTIYTTKIEINDLNVKVLNDLSGSKQIDLINIDLYTWASPYNQCIALLRESKEYYELFSFSESKGTFQCFSDKSKKLIKRLLSNYLNIYQYDSPDIIIENDNLIIGIEHFKVDSSVYKKGYESQRKLNNLLNDIAKKRAITVNEVIDNSLSLNLSLQNLMLNMRKTLDNHYNKIDIYRERMISIKKVKTMIGFLIEDITIMGTYVLEPDREFTLFLPFLTFEFWDMVMGKNIDFLLYKAKTGKSNIDERVYFLTKEDYFYLKEKNSILNLNQYKGLYFDNPHILSYAVELKRG